MEGAGLPKPDRMGEVDTAPPNGENNSTDPLAQLARAIPTARSNSDPPSESTSEEDYDDLHRPSPSVLLRRRGKADSYDNSGVATPEIVPLDTSRALGESSGLDSIQPRVSSRPTFKGQKTYVVASDDAELREILRKGLERERDDKSTRRPKFRNMVFTRQFSTFDRQNRDVANSQFHGFYVLFWISVAILIVKMAAENWKNTGSPLGTNEIVHVMFRREVMALLLSDGAMCGLTGVSWVIQRLVHAGLIDWDRTGWIIQNIWQSAFIGGFVGWPHLREWPWTHTVFFVLHGLVMLMKQHSYAFYNGHLSSIYKKRRSLAKRFKRLGHISPVNSPSSTSPPPSELYISHLARRPSAAEYQEKKRLSKAQLTADDNTDIEKILHAIDSGEPLDSDQLHLFERLIQWEIEAIDDELGGKATDAKRSYPHNLTLANHYEYIVLPTVVYELGYPRSDSINWLYVAEKAAALFGVILVMVMISQAFIYPVVMRTVLMKEAGLSTADRFREFPWLLSDLLFPMMIEWLMSWYLIWETILNILAEITFFADRSFYDAWWNSVSWDQFARDWNRPVHNFLLRHVYHSSISSMKVDKHTATLITFFLSAAVHELVMWCIFKKLRGYLMVLQMCQLPLVALSRTRWLRNQKTLGNMMFWVGIFTGPSMLCSLYLIL